MKVLPLVIALVMVPHCLFATGTEVQERDCLKQVFDRYCLGGQISSLPKAEAIQQGDRPGEIKHLFSDVVVTSLNGKIVGVTRLDLGATLMDYLELRGSLRAIYGDETDLSWRLVENGSTLNGSDASGALEGLQDAIESGQARMQHLWPTDNFAISLYWSEVGLSLTYETQDWFLERNTGGL